MPADDPFYVHIVESPSPEELLGGLTEGRALCSFLDVAEIQYVYNLAVDRVRFEEAMSHRFHEGYERIGAPPILHLSCHGDRAGIQLTEQRGVDTASPNGLIKWDELANLIRPIYQRVGDLGVCMSCCCGAYGKNMADVRFPKDVPFSWLVGTPQKIGLCDAALAFAVFYRIGQRGDVSNALKAMRLVSGIDDFEIVFGPTRQKHHSAIEQLKAAIRESANLRP